MFLTNQNIDKIIVNKGDPKEAKLPSLGAWWLVQDMGIPSLREAVPTLAWREQSSWAKTRSQLKNVSGA
jgi:hypothetical protein